MVEIISPLKRAWSMVTVEFLWQGFLLSKFNYFSNYSFFIDYKV